MILKVGNFSSSLITPISTVKYHSQRLLQYKIMASSIEIHPITFPPEVLARIAPDLSIQRHLSLGVRPCLRQFEEFRTIEISDGGLSRSTDLFHNSEENNILGSNVLRSGKTIVITSITGGFVEELLPVHGIDEGEEELRNMTMQHDRISQFGAVYPVVEVERGRMGAPTDEEMNLSQKIYNCILGSGVIPKSSLNVSVGRRTTNPDKSVSITYPDEEGPELDQQFLPKRKWSYVLYAKIQVFSRDGPLFELCWNSLIYALKNTKLPRAFVDEKTTDLKIPVRVRGRSAAIRETYDIICDSHKSIPLVLNSKNVGFASNFGVIDLDPEARLPEKEDEMQVDQEDSILLADLQGEAEESSVLSTLSIISDEKGNLKHLGIIGGGSKVTTETIRRSILLSSKRSEDLSTKN